ncbi:MAG: hypothetical protein M1813_006515 [Trichoglossum hirsutum]|nr:MAG: hypothetical protein M1813_006515 [Trichoglossum hirsutum]
MSPLEPSILGRQIVPGSTQSAQLPKFLTNNPLPNGFPWGLANSNTSNPFGPAPNTGVTRTYDFTIKRQKKSPDGVQRDVLIVNGQFPGPTIQANWGDMIQVTVHNQITGPDEGTAFHWHGLIQTGTPYMDGVPGVTQCPIPSGQSFTYAFRADQIGTSWWHSHYSAQYSGGALGPMVIYGPSHVPYDNDVGPMLLTDWYHRPYLKVVEQVMQPVPIVGGAPDFSAIIPLSDNNLINGQNNFDCSLITDGTPCKSNAGVPTFRFSPGKNQRIRIINAGSEAVQKFSIDGHELTVIATDFTQIVPYTTKVVTLGVGQRTDVIVKGLANGTGAYWVRSTISSCSFTTQPNALGIAYYLHDALNTPPTTTAWPDTTDPCANDPIASTVPWFPIPAAPSPATTASIEIGATINATGNFVWTMNGSAFRANYNNPTLLLAKAGNTSYPFDPQWNVMNFGSNSSIRLVVVNNSPAVHPMHIHGHALSILAEGPTPPWDGTVTNQANPARRDTHLITPFGGFAVYQFNADNPGVWPFHCHIAWHVSGGLYVNIMERPDDIVNINIPSSLVDTCHQWADFTGTQVPNQIDSGE